METQKNFEPTPEQIQNFKDNVLLWAIKQQEELEKKHKKHEDKG